MTLEEISEAAAAAHEKAVQESIQLDYAYLAGKLPEWLDRKYAEVLGDIYGGSNKSRPGR